MSITELRTNQFKDGTILDSDVASNANISLSKLGSNTVDRNFVSETEKATWNGKISSTEILIIKKLTQAEYDALTPVSTTLYIIVG